MQISAASPKPGFRWSRVGLKVRDREDAIAVRHPPQTVRELDRLANAEIEVRQYVRPPETKHQEHVRGPPADAFDSRECRDDVVVGELVQMP